MSPRVRALGGLVVAAAVARLGLALGGAGEGAAVAAPVLAPFDPAAVARVVLRRGERAATLARDPAAGWVAGAPGGPAAPARPEAVEALVARLLGWRRERLAGEDPARHAEWRVTDALARRVRLEAADGRALGEVLVGTIAGLEPTTAAATGGRTDPARLGLFVRAEGEAATWVVSDFVTRELEPDLAGWLAPPLPAGPADEVRRLALTGPGLAVALTFAPGQAPRLEGDPRPVDPVRARALVAAARGLLPRGVAAGPALDPATAVTVELGLAPAGGGAAGDPAGGAGGAASAASAVVARARLARDGDAWHAAALGPDGRPGPTLALDAAAPARLVALARDLVRRALVLVRPEHLARAHLVARDVERTLARDPRGGGWRLVTTGPTRPLVSRPLDEAAARALLAAAAGLEAAAWDPGAPAPAPPGAEAPLRLLLVDVDGARLEVTLGDEVATAGAHDAPRLRPGRAAFAPAPFWVDAAPVRAMLDAFARAGD